MFKNVHFKTEWHSITILDTNESFRPIINAVREEPLTNCRWMICSTCGGLQNHQHWQWIPFPISQQSVGSKMQISCAPWSGFKLVFIPLFLSWFLDVYSRWTSEIIITSGNVMLTELLINVLLRLRDGVQSFYLNFYYSQWLKCRTNRGAQRIFHSPPTASHQVASE